MTVKIELFSSFFYLEALPPLTLTMHPVGLSLTSRYLEQIERIKKQEQNETDKEIKDNN